MAYRYVDVQNEVKHRGVRDQGGTQFDTPVKNIVNSSLFRLSREALWRPLRRKSTFSTFAKYTTGTVTATLNSTTVTGSGTSWVTAGIYVGQRMTIQGSTKSYVIQTITGATGLTLDKVYDGTTASSKTYTIFGREEYNMPMQCGRTGFLWHEQFGYPYVMRYMPDPTFYRRGIPLTFGNIPVLYRMWGEDDVIQQPLTPSVLTISSSSSSDTNKQITIFGTVSSYPDYEVITTNASDGTTAVAGSKSFSSVERIDKDASTIGRITVTANSATVTVAVLPVGNVDSGVKYKKVQFFPLPDSAFPVNVQYYKDPWRLVNDGDIHELGSDFDEALILLSVAKIKAENAQKEAEMWYSMYKDEVRSLKKVNADKLDYFPSLKRPGRAGAEARFHPQVAYSQIGGLFGPTEAPQLF